MRLNLYRVKLIASNLQFQIKNCGVHTTPGAHVNILTIKIELRVRNITDDYASCTWQLLELLPFEPRE